MENPLALKRPISIVRAVLREASVTFVASC
jgi:hypothetical protein